MRHNVELPSRNKSLARNSSLTVTNTPSGRALSDSRERETPQEPHTGLLYYYKQTWATNLGHFLGWCQTEDLTRRVG